MTRTPAPTEDRLIAAHRDAADFYRHQLPDALPALRYLTSRGIIAATAHRPPWTLGYAPRDWTALRDHLRERGYTDAELLAAGLVTTIRTGSIVDVFRERVMFPIRRADGAVVAFIGRDVSDWPGAPKYRNTATTPIYRKREHLYGLAELPPVPAAVMLVEGPSDVVAASRLTIDGRPCGAVAPCGTALTAQQITGLAAAMPDGTPLIVALDADYAGRTATARAYPLLRDWPGPLEAVVLPASSDPADLIVRGRETAERFLQDQRQPLPDVLIRQRLERHRLDEVPGRVAALHDVAPLVADTAARDTEHASRLCAGLADQLHLDPLTILEAVYPAPDDPPPRAETERIPHSLDESSTGHEYAYRYPPNSTTAIRVHHDRHSGRTAWALAEAVTDTPADRAAARLAAEIAARTAVIVGARSAVELTRTAINARFRPPATARGDATIAVLTTHPPTGPHRPTLAWAGAIHAYGAAPHWFGPLVPPKEGLTTATVRSGPIGVNHIDRPLTHIVLAGEAASSVLTPDLREAVDGRRAEAAAEALDRLGLGSAVTVRLRHHLVGTARQDGLPARPQPGKQPQLEPPPTARMLSR